MKNNIIFSVITLGLFFCTAHSALAITFNKQTIVGDTDPINDAAFGDFGADGDEDIAVASQSGNQSRFLDNDGSENFSVEGIAPLSVRAVAVGDVNEDGDDDFYWATAATNTLSLSNGVGGYVDTQITGDVAVSSGAAFADFDGDNDIDIYVTNNAGGNEQNVLWINDGSENFSASNIAGDTFSSQGLAIGDVDGDGDIDIYVANSADDDEQNKLWINNGSGSFSASDITSDTGSSQDAVMLDVEGDGDLDIYVVNGSAQLNKLWINNGSGSFTSGAITSDPGEITDDNGTDAAAGDIDGDGDDDLAVFYSDSDTYLWLNDGSGEFSSEVVPSSNLGTVGGAMGDIDGDGDLDLYIGGESGNALFINIDFGVTVNQASGQDDPTETNSAEFTVTFDEAIATTTFVAGDITLSGTAGTITTGPIEIAPNDGTTFSFTVTGMSDGDTVTATMAAGVVGNVAENAVNFPSTATDNSITYALAQVEESEETESRERARGGRIDRTVSSSSFATAAAESGSDVDTIRQQIESQIIVLLKQIIALLTEEIERQL